MENFAKHLAHRQMHGIRLWSRIAFLSLAIFLAGALSSARADWHPGYPGGANYGADVSAALLDSLGHSYPTAKPVAPCNPMFGYNTAGEVTTACINGVLGSTSVTAYAVNPCATGTIGIITGCSNGPQAYQGKPACPVGNPVNVISGNKFEQAIDFTTSGAQPLSLERSYNSDLNYVVSRRAAYSSAQAAFQSRFGIGWRSNFDRFISGSSLSSSTIAIDAIRPDGSPVRFGKSGGVWTLRWWDPSIGA